MTVINSRSMDQKYYLVQLSQIYQSKLFFKINCANKVSKHLQMVRFIGT